VALVVFECSEPFLVVEELALLVSTALLQKRCFGDGTK
jgi:hypothetical protein